MLGKSVMLTSRARVWTPARGSSNGSCLASMVTPGATSARLVAPPFTTVLRNNSTTGTTSSSSSSSTSPSTPPLLLTVDKIPVPTGNWPLVGHLPRLVQGGDSIVNWQSMHDECGEIFRCIFPGGKKDIIVTKNIEHSKTILSSQGKYPVRTPQTSWKAVF